MTDTRAFIIEMLTGCTAGNLSGLSLSELLTIYDSIVRGEKI
jgi:hypothetical protein